MLTLSEEDWWANGEKLFGNPPRGWKFQCPNCGGIQTGKDLMDLGLSEVEAMSKVFRFCVGNFTKGKGCDLTLDFVESCHSTEVVLGEQIVPVFEYAK